MKLTEGKRFEKNWPYAFGLLALALCILAITRGYKLPDKFRDIFPATLNISAITIGFLATAKSIMFSLGDTRRVRTLRANGQMGLLIDYLLSAIRWGFVLSIVSAICLVIDLTGTYAQACLAVWTVALAIAGAWCYQVITLLALMLRSKDS
jgi:hypothetical protein